MPGDVTPDAHDAPQLGDEHGQSTLQLVLRRIDLPIALLRGPTPRLPKR